VSESSWNLVIPVLLIGLVIGGVWVVWWRRRSGEAQREEERDRQLLLADLQARQAQLYEQLRQAAEPERESLELAAARNLRAIELAGGSAKTAAPPAGVAPAAADTAPALPVRRPASPWLGFVGGVACAALVGLLILWAQRDAKPRPGEMAAPAPQSAEHPGGPGLSERDRQALQQLAATVDNDPTDLMARKQYAVGLLSTGQFMPAFEQAEILLASNPDDPDGLYVKGMIRMQMGNEAEARSLLERLVVDYPDHVPALTALGVLALREGGMPAAENFWNQALEASGGRNPEIERLMAAAREQFGDAGEVPARPGPMAAAPRQAPTASAESPLPQAGSSYTLELELGSGAQVPSGAVLFVALRAGAGGPPSAVRRIQGPSFPMTITLGEGDTMMGQPLPEAGMVSVRLDFDGSASTRVDGEPEGQAQMRIGETARLTLQ
jgi:tetratricopeptide (TPR) repeat protein